MIDGSKTRKSLAGVEVQSLYVIERRSNKYKTYDFIGNFCVFSRINPDVSKKSKIYPLPHMYVVKDLVPVS